MNRKESRQQELGKERRGQCFKSSPHKCPAELSSDDVVEERGDANQWGGPGDRKKRIGEWLTLF